MSAYSSPADQSCLPTSLTLDDLRRIHRQAGDVITENADGSFTASKNPELDPDQRVEQFKKIMLDRQAAAESGGGTMNQ